jgi:hypothetical protein
MQRTISNNEYVAAHAPEMLATVVEQDTQPGSGSQALLITRVQQATDASEPVPANVQAELVGTVRWALPAFSTFNGWMFNYRANDGEHYALRVFGGPVNPEPINGHTYRILAGQNTAQRMVRYNDDAHRGDRDISTCPWSIIEADIGVPQLFSDGYSQLSLLHVEVRSGAEAEAESVPETVGIPTDNRTEPQRWMFGMALADADGMVELNPDPEPGKRYLMHKPDINRTYHALAGNDKVLRTYGYATITDSFLHDMYSNLDDYSGELVWAEAAPSDRVTPISEELAAARIAELRAELRQDRLDFRSFRVALNDLATESSWCSEYEETMRRLGMMTERQTRRSPLAEIGEDGEELEPENQDFRKAWKVEVSYSVTIRDSSPSGSTDRHLTDEYGINVDSSDLRFDTSGTVYVDGIITEDEVDDEDTAMEMVDSTMVEDAIRNQLERGYVDDLLSWDADSAEEDDDYELPEL